MCYYYCSLFLSFEQTKIGDTVSQIVDPKQDEISRTIHIGNVTATVHSTMISSVLQVQTQNTTIPISKCRWNATRLFYFWPTELLIYILDLPADKN